MTSGSPPQRKARETNFTDIGVAGRKTGFMVKDTGRRDSYGMEPMDAFFSPPPQPAPVQTNMLRDIPSSAADSQLASGAHNGTISIEESMDIANSSAVEPAAALSARRLASLPPRARSPIKTNLKSPARRASTIDFSSPEKGPVQPANRLLQFGSSSSGEPSSASQFSKPAQRLSMSPMRGGGSTGSASGREGKFPADRSKGKGKQAMPRVAEEERLDNKSVPPPPAAAKPKRGLLTQKRVQPAPKAFVLEGSSDDSGGEDIAMGGAGQVWEESIDTDAFEVAPGDDDSVMAEEEPEAPPTKKGKQVEGRESAKQKPAPLAKKAKAPPPEKGKPQPKTKANGIGKGKGKALEDGLSPPLKTRPAVGGEPRAMRKTGKPFLQADESEDDGELEEEPIPVLKPKSPAKGKARTMRKTGKPYVPSDEGEGDDGELEEKPILAPKPKAPVRAKGRPKSKLAVEASEEQREEEEEEEEGKQKPTQPLKAKAISKGKAKAKAAEAGVEKVLEPSQQTNIKPLPKGKGRAQPKASKAPEPEIPESDRDEQSPAEESEQELEQPARKRPRKSPKEVVPPPTKASAKSKGKAPAVSKAAKKQPAAVRREYSPELQSHVPSPVARRPAAKGASSSSRPPQPQKQGKGGQRVIREKPEPGPEPTGEGRRPSRQRIKPLEFWKGEKVVYTLGERRKSGAANAIKMPEIAEIIRIESDQEEKARERERRRKKSASAGAKRKRPVKEEESDYDEEDWETRVVDGEVGVVRGYVKTFPSSQIPGQEMLEEVELAFSRNRIVTVEVANSAFTFVKTYTQPYFGTGIIEIPPGGIKRTKNSGKMQLVFFILAGKVQVQIGETSFRIRKGSQFMVPRGNLYSIENPYDHQAKMFFAQGCEVDPEDE